MKTRYITLLALFVLLSGLMRSVFSAEKDAPEYSFKKTDDSVALLNGGKVVWKHNHKVSEGKPYIHPLSTIDGEVLTRMRPADHVWHRAMWFSWKKINGLNYWEEDRRTGLSQGRTEIKSVKVKTKRNKYAEIKMTLSYHPPEKPELLAEKREIVISIPDKEGKYYIDWTSSFKAAEDVKLDRTPIQGEPGGKGWGGYAGFSIRMAKETRGWKFVNSDNLAGMKLHGKPAQWVHAYGKTPSGKNAGLTILDHSSNIRHPSPWYLADGMPYFSPAPIFKEPYTLKKGESFTLKYRVIVHSCASDIDDMGEEVKKFSKK